MTDLSTFLIAATSKVILKYMSNIAHSQTKAKHKYKLCV